MTKKLYFWSRMDAYTDCRYHFAALFAVAVWGATFVSTKVLIANGLTPAEIFVLRFALAYLTIWCLRPFSQGGLPGIAGQGLRTPRRMAGRPDCGVETYDAKNCDAKDGHAGERPGHRRPGTWRDELTLCAAGVAGGSLYFLTENLALEYAPASNVSLIVCTAPVWTALLLSLLYRSERMSRRQAAGCAMAFAGTALVVLNGHFVLKLSPRGDLLALASALLWMCYSLLVKRIGGRYDALSLTRRIFFYGLLTILPWFAYEPFAVSREVLLRPVVWGNLLFLGLVASMLCYVLWNAAMHRLGAVRTTNYIYFNPLVTMLTAALCIGERITPAALAGAALILVGVWLAEKSPHRAQETARRKRMQ